MQTIQVMWLSTQNASPTSCWPPSCLPIPELAYSYRGPAVWRSFLDPPRSDIFLLDGTQPALHPTLNWKDQDKFLTWGWVIMLTIVSTWRRWARKLRDRWWHVNRCWCPLECGWELGRSMSSLDTEGWCWWGCVEGVQKGPLSFPCRWKSKDASQCSPQILMENLKKTEQIKKKRKQLC